MPQVPLAMLIALACWTLPATAAPEDFRAPATGPKAGGGARAADPLGNLEPYEQRRYRIDMQDCEKQAGADRRVCERTVHNKAAAKSRRRGAAGY